MVKEMDGPDKGVLSSSTPIKASEFPRVTVSDENDQSNQQLGPNPPNPKKLTQKHYMSPTISAASKATVPRKKILGERNEASESIFSEPHVQKASNIESKLTFANPGTDVSDIPSPQGFESNGNEQNAVIAEGSLKPYDPLTNYLSPRPKFLRYKPNRRREIFFRLEDEIRVEKDGLSISTSGSFESQKVSDEESDSGCDHGSLVSSSQEGSGQQEDEGIEESDEEIEEERGWSVKRVLESLLWFVLLVFSTLYISSMNFPAPSPSLQSFEGPRYGCCNIQNHTVEALVKTFDSGSHIWDQREEIQMGLDQRSQEAIDEWLKEEEMVQDVKMGGVEIAEELNEVELEGGESEAIEVDEDEKKEVVGELREVLLVDPQAEDIKANCDNQRVFTREISDQMDENSEVQNAGTKEKFEAFKDYEAPSMSDGVGHHIIESDISNVLEEENDVWLEATEEVNNEKAGDEEMIERNMEEMENVMQVISSERMDNVDPNTEILSLELEEDLEEGPKKKLETESLLKPVIGVLVFSMIVAFLVLDFCFKRKKTIGKDSSLIAKPCSGSLIVEKNKTIEKESLISIEQNETTRKDSLIVKPCIESVMAEKCSAVLPNREEAHIARADSFRSHSSFHPIKEVSKDYHESQAPSVELLGEFVVGEVSSSLRSCGVKNRRMESEESSYSVSTDKKSWSKSHSVPVQSQSAFSEFSSRDSHSNGRFTAEQKVMKKEEGKDGEVTEITTPVRRSSRIRNRSVMSP